MNRVLTLAAALLVAVVDQVTKHTAEVRLGGLPEGQAAVLVPGLLYLKPVANTGAIWNTFQGLSPVFFVALSIIFVVFATALILRLAEEDHGYLPALALVLGGFVGNGIDRIRLGAVTDFIHFTGYPAWFIASFNVADLAILSGILWIVARFCLTRRSRSARKPGRHSEKKEES